MYAFLEKADYPWGYEWRKESELENDRRIIKNIDRRLVNLIFDARPIEGFSLDGEDAIEDLTYVRVITTVRKFKQYARASEIVEGRWYALELYQNGKGPRAWTSDMSVRQSSFRWSLTRAQALEEASAGFQSLVQDPSVVEKLKQKYFIKASRLNNKQRALPSFSIGSVVAIDVGQASCIAICSPEGEAHGFFDVGYPINSNAKSAPAGIKLPPTAPNCFVLLSHWDYDHYSLAFRQEELKNLVWYAPGNLGVGPRAYKLSKEIRSLNAIAYGGSLTHPSLEIGWGTGPISNRNSSGICCLVRQGKRSILLTADVSYSNIPSLLLHNLDALSVPHHGGRSESAIPIPKAASKQANAVVCGGKPNRYQHPCENYLMEHAKKGWKVSITGVRYKGLPRGGNIVF